MRNEKHVILVVDDDPDVLDSLRLVLEAHGYAVEAAAGAEEGLRSYRGCEPDLIIVDLMMEEVDSGTRLLKELRLLGNSAPVYMLSAVGDSFHENVDYTELALAGVFQKPIDNETLLAALASKLK